MEMKNSNKKTVLATLIAAVIASTQASGQEAGFSAEIDSRITDDNNILRAADEFAKSDTILVVAPKLEILGSMGKHSFSATYNGEYAKYSDFSDVDYDDHDVSLRANFDHSNNLTSRFDVIYTDNHENLADLDGTFNDLTEFNHFTESQLNGRIVYGRTESFGQLILGLGRADRDYDNNSQESRSYEKDLASLAFYYRIAPRTRLLAEVVYEDYKYSPAVGSTDLANDYIRYQLGVEWQLTNQLEGTVKVGYQDRDYILEALRDVDGLVFEANIDYKPNTFTDINLTGRRESIDSSIETSGAFLRTSYAIDIKHGLTELLSVEGGMGYAKDELVFTADRQDNRYNVMLGLDYALLNWVNVGVNYGYDQRTSTIDTAEYKSNSINLTVKVALD
jgi:hypothetical protein